MNIKDYLCERNVNRLLIMTLKEYITDARRRLETRVDSREAYWIARDMVEDVLGYSEVDFLLKGDEEASGFVVSKIETIVARLLEGEPLQYILGWARFAGLRFKVTPHTLIPRPETQELVDGIIHRHGSVKDLRVMDIGTGSGCIAVSLARGLRFAQVSAIDISRDALDVARENAKRLKVDVDFRLRDALTLVAESADRYDIIVSNPPYIANKERYEMEAVVLDYEPAAALFVPDDDPLCFYRSIARWGMEVLTPGGEVWYEINPLYASPMVEMMNELGYVEVELMKDMQNRDRILCAKKTLTHDP